MLFVTLMKRKVPVPETTARRLEWKYPEEIRVIAEYWLQTPDPSVIVIAEVDSIAPMMAALSPWSDAFDSTVVPAVTAEEGLQLARRMMGK